MRIVGDGYLDTVEWQTVTPNLHGDWVNQRDDAFSAWPVIGDKKAALDVTRVFANYSAGLKTSRDAWCYNFSRGALEANIGRTIDFYNSEVDRINEIRGRDAKTPPVDALITVDSAKFSWDRINKRQVAQGIRIEFAPANAARHVPTIYERARLPRPQPAAQQLYLPASVDVSDAGARECRLLRGWHGLRQALLVSDAKRYPRSRILGLKQRSILPALDLRRPNHVTANSISSPPPTPK